MNLSFLGAVGTVTGSKYLISHAGQQVLVDCGLFQGYKNLRELNWEGFSFDPTKLSAVVLTHAHIDHSGALPLLLRAGYRGPIYATSGTIDLCELLLPDSGRLQEEEAEYVNRHHTSKKHQKALPLYTEEDARRTLRYMQLLPFHGQDEIAPGMQLTLHAAGHILGASMAEVVVNGTRILFSGDVGRPNDLIMRAPDAPPAVDYMVVESTYGDRLHDKIDYEAVLADIINRTAARGGSVLVPAFAVGRAQALLYAVARLKARQAIPDLPVFLNSPMAIDTTEIYHRHRTEHRLSVEECRSLCQVAKMVRTPEESRALNEQHYPMVIISASGMATGGRVLHHLRSLAPDRRNTIVLVGYQAGGTRGARLAAGENHIRIFGEDVPVHAEVVSLLGMSAHADAQQIVDWLQTAPTPPKKVFVTHGEPAAADALRLRIQDQLHWNASVPHLGQVVELNGQAQTT